MEFTEEQEALIDAIVCMTSAAEVDEEKAKHLEGRCKSPYLEAAKKRRKSALVLDNILHKSYRQKK